MASPRSASMVAGARADGAGLWTTVSLGELLLQGIATAHRELGRPTDFATQSDRELIGRILIGQLREG